MPPLIGDSKTERLARALAERTGETIGDAAKRALEERLRRVESPARRAALLDEMNAICRKFDALPDLDHRSPDDIIGYDDHGLPS